MQPAEMIYHITSGQEWESSLATGQYAAVSLGSEGFIHFSGASQVIATANRYYKGQWGLVLLQVDVKRLAAELKYEKAPSGELFPHLYGPLNLDAVQKVYPFEPEGNGEFITVPE
jgi:uncharacterized protein (DUF952 family)